ncbi:HAD family hydrolase [Rhodococcus maanshanensis]|uniref:HAD-superfamily subfamily IB hydrolase, TIGR01490 n=1 Tax=Rhodococcus maanshanensis TaxID=183556 RepID=A0A1H7HKI5_9NOCA|nr:HAD-IB family hydrolase [Rhodococcus maanshanensis]SEK50779.1 HAD-superfamily subfamily IB hydrolase, TIGR01490 [Rhodococcus maanshanensis]
MTGTGPRPAQVAFFDVDETLITVKSMFAFLEHWLWERGDDGSEYARLLGALRRQADEGAPREEVNRSYYRTFRGVPLVELEESGRRWYREFESTNAPYYAATLAALHAHREAGAVIVLLSGSFAPVLVPIGEAVGADRIVASRPVTDQGGVLTGEVERPMIGKAKAEAVTSVQAELGVDAENSYGYGDHESDLAFLEEVGHPGLRGDDQVLLARAARDRWRFLGSETTGLAGDGPLTGSATAGLAQRGIL